MHADDCDRIYLKMIQPFRLLDLPAELIRQIRTDSDFDKHDLMALRLTCALTRDSLTQLFDSMCFIGISVLLTRRSLQALIDISKHPRIGPKIQSVTITPLRTFPEALQSLLSVKHPVYREGDLANAKASAKAVHQYLDRYHEEMELELTSDASRLLTEAFMTLRTYDGPLCLEVTDLEETHIGAQGCISGALIEEEKEWSVFKLYWEETVSLMIKAVVDGGCQVARLSLACVTDAELMDGGKLWNNDLDEYIDRLSGNLTAFDVDVHCHDPETVLKSVKRVVAQAKDLEILNFHRCADELFDDFVEISNSIASSSLEAFNKSYVCCSVSDMILFLSKHKSTLDHISLSDVRLVGSWKALVQWIIPNLTSLSTFIMDDVNDDEFHSGPLPRCNLDELEDMPTALEKLLAETKHHEASANNDTLPTD
jgi:hypothetical protein